MMLSRSLGLIAAAFLAACNPSPQSIHVTELQEHVHAIAVEGSLLLLATHGGLYSSDVDGNLFVRSGQIDLESLQVHPNNPGTLLATGHRPNGEVVGVAVSNDGGRTWNDDRYASQRVDLHQIAVGNNGGIYGLGDGLYVIPSAANSPEQRRLNLPDAATDLAASRINADLLFLATRVGLFFSRDAGATWESMIEGEEVTLVVEDGAGGVFAFVVGRGLIHIETPGTAAPFELVTVGWVDPLVELAIDHNTDGTMYSMTRSGTIVKSVDRGRTWTVFGA